MRFLTRLRTDVAGNTLMLVAASIIPLTALIGAGVDISRSYLVKSRLQAACDAGALAGRKFMTNGTLDTATIAKARAYFNNNFPPGAFGTTNITFTPSLDADNQVQGTASARVPMTVMTVFRHEYTDLTVSCRGRLDIGNTDVMLVLDVTGSMGGSLGSTTRIGALKTAVINFFDTLGPGDPAEGRIRYGVVPYSTTVNVGYSLPPEYIVGGDGGGDWTYQTRVANMTKPHYVGTPGTPTNLADQIYSSGASISSANCQRYGNNQSFTGFTGGTNPTVTGGPPPAATTAVAYSNNATGGVDWGYPGAPDTTGTTRSCRRHRVQTVTTYTIDGYEQQDSGSQRWIYRQAIINVAGYAQGNPVTIFDPNMSGIPSNETVPASGEYDLRSVLSTPGSTVTGGISVTWNGCIEERNTIDTITGTTPIGSVPAGAYDLDVDLIPNSDETRWKPAWLDMVFNRDTEADSFDGWKESDVGCPDDRARKLMTYTSIDSAPNEAPTLSTFRNYINNLQIGGGTLHDIGMVWGARFISGTGLFSAENPDTWNGQPVQRHVVFMTDGEMNPRTNRYTFHGINDLDQRVATRGTSWNSLVTIHNRRFRIICEQAKQRNITVWTIAFADGVASDYPDLVGCATSSDHFFFAADAADLNSAFRDIATRISKLRLTN